MTPIEIEAMIGGIILLTQMLINQISKAENLTDEEKKAYIDRITAAQASVPEWK